MSNFDLEYAIAAGHHLTAKVAEDVLKSGGNAFDATVAAYTTMFLTEPAMSSACAGGFANVHFASGENYILDFFCQTPFFNNLSNPSYDEIIVDFGESQESFFIGPASMAVPGAMAFISYLHKNFCTIPILELVQPAIEYAKSGIQLTPFQAEDIDLLKQIFGHSAHGRSLFFKDNIAKKTGDELKMSGLADFLYCFAKENSDWFYHGEIAQGLVNHTTSNGGFLKMIDFEKYQIRKVSPLHFYFQGSKISVPQLPSMGGGLLSLFLHNIQDESITPLGVQHLNLLRNQILKCIPLTKNKEALYNKLSAIYPSYQEPESRLTKHTSGTSHFNIVDKFGNGISLSTSIGEGAGYFIPGTDMQMNNMLGETALLPNGLNSWEENVRLNSMMCPTLVYDKSDNLELLTGTGGATRIPFSIAQLLINLKLLDLDLDQAIHLPRIFENDAHLYLEEGFDTSKLNVNKAVKIWEGLELLFGGTHTIDLKNKIAIGDNRREGIGIIK